MKGAFIVFHAGFRRTLRRTILFMCALTIADASQAGEGGGSTPYSGNSTLVSPEAQSTAQNATTREISGQVFDTQGIPLIGATVIIKGTSKGVHTDTKGAFTLTIPNTDKAVVLVVSYVGMKPREIGITTQKTIQIKLEPDTEIDEVVVTGYGVIQRRSDLAGSAYEVKAEDIKMLPAKRIDNLLEGQVPGLVVLPNIDSPGAPRSRLNIRIRGDASLSASNEPLWIIDGVPIYTGGTTNQVSGMSYSVTPLAGINPDDIESMTVLKDASTTALYGADGSNGVILVTTKRGQAGKTRFNASMRYGISAIDQSTRIKMLNASQWWEYARTAWANAGYAPENFPFQDNEYNSYSTTDTDWGDVYFRIGQNYQADFSVSGGNDRINTYFSASYYRQESTQIGNTTDRVTARSNTNFNINRWLSAQVILSGSFSTDNMLPIGHEYYETLPIFSPYNSDGTYRTFNYYSQTLENYSPTRVKFFDNTLQELQNDNRQRAYLGTANFLLKWKPVEGLTATTQFGTDYQSRYGDIYEARTTVGGWDGWDPVGYSRRESALSITWVSLNQINYSRTFGRHTLNAVAGLELRNVAGNSVYASGSHFINDGIKEIYYAQNDTRSGGSSMNHTRRLSYLAQLIYAFDNRYSVTGNWRRDGSSSFGPYSIWQNFGSIGGTWNIHNEKFFKSNLISLLKLRATFGITGNSRVDSNVGGTYVYNDSSFYNGQMGATQGSAPNPYLGWERTYTTNLGLDMSLGKRVFISLDAYQKHTVDLIYSGYVSMTVTDQSVKRNVGEILNRGIELDINSRNIDHPEFVWTTRFNIAHNKSKILKLYNNMSTGFFDTVWMEGYDPNTHYLSEWAGVDPRDGSPMWYDVNGNIVKTFSYNNRRPGRIDAPTVTGGMINNLQWRNFSLSILLNYQFGGWAFCSLGSRTLNDGRDILESNARVEALDYWKEPGDLAVNPKPVVNNTTQSGMSSSRYLYRRAFINVKNVALTYSIPERITRRLGLNTCDISLIADNLYLWVPGQSRTRNSYKTLMNAYPVERTFSVNLAVSF